MLKETFDDIWFVFKWSNTVFIGMGFWEYNRRREAAERRVRLQLCLLVSTLDNYFAGDLINLARFV